MPSTATAHASDRDSLFEVATLSDYSVLQADHIIILQSLITKLARSKGMQKMIIAGLGLAFLGIMISSLGKDWLFAAGVLFVATAVMGIIGILKMRKTT